MSRGTVIIGSGQAGFQTAATLRSEGYLEPITLIGEERHIPYQRPPLSKGFPLGKQDFESLQLRPAKFYEDHAIRLLAGENAVALDCASRRVTLASGRPIEYDTLVLATGARNRGLRVPGAELAGVLFLRTLDEAIALKERIAEANEIVVIGGGFIGLEMAAVASALSKRVTVLEALPRLMSRAVAPVISEFFLQRHQTRGVKVICGAPVTQVVGRRGKATGIALHDGNSMPADLVLVGIGVLPNVELAQSARLPVTNGIAVNEFLQTADDKVFAIGDCAEHPCAQTGERVRLESVQNAADQAQCAARSIAGKRERYSELPWFWSDQFDVKLQMAGLSGGHNRVVMRGSTESGDFSAFYFRDEKFIAVDSVNRPLDHMMGRKLLSSGIAVTPEEAADESFDLKALARSAARSTH